MQITAAQVQHVYDFLRTLPPFNGWRLPMSQGIIIKVISSKEVMGDYESDPHTLRISKVMCQDWLQVLETVAHEMVHVALEKEGKTHGDHGDAFKEKATQVCKHWGWKEATF